MGKFKNWWTIKEYERCLKRISKYEHYIKKTKEYLYSDRKYLKELRDKVDKIQEVEIWQGTSKMN